jgi:hypothetical protein
MLLLLLAITAVSVRKRSWLGNSGQRGAKQSDVEGGGGCLLSGPLRRPKYVHFFTSGIDRKWGMRDARPLGNSGTRTSPLFSWLPRTTAALGVEKGQIGGTEAAEQMMSV